MHNVRWLRNAVAIRRRPVAAEIGLGLAGAAYAFHAYSTVRLPLEPLLALVPDDAFYYAGIARHLAASGSPTFDGVNVTNGFHPAWMAVLVAMASTGLGALGLVRGALAAAYLLHGATAIALFLLLRRASGMLAAPALGAALWLLNPFPLLLAGQGVESSLFLLAVVVFFHAHLGVLERVPRGDAPRWPYACAAAFVAWSRTDAALLPMLGFLQLLVRGSRTPGFVRGLVRQAGAVVLLLLPWLAFSWATTGSFVQDSAAMKATWRTLDARIGGDPVGWQVLGGAWFGIPAAWLSGAMVVSAMLPLARALVVVGAASSVLLLERRSAWRDLVVLVMAWMLAAGAAYAWTITDLQVWHFAPCGIALFLVTWIGWARLAAIGAPRWRPGFALLGTAAAAGAIVLALWSARNPPALYPWQPDIYRSVAAFDALLPASAVVGSFGAGIAGTLGRRPVVNLDGLVNHAAVAYWRERRWNEYVRAAGITHIADDRSNLERAFRFSSGPVTLTPLASVPLTGWHSSPRTLWRVEARPGASPAPPGSIGGRPR